MTITYKLEPDDLRAFQRYNWKRLPSALQGRYVLPITMVVIPSLLVWISDEHRNGLGIVYFSILLFLFWAIMHIWMLVVTRVMQGQRFTLETHRSVICEHTVTLADDALIETTAFNESRNLWGGIYRVVDAADYIYIFVSLRVAHIIPKRAFTDTESGRRFYERAVSLHSAAQRATAEPCAAPNVGPATQLGNSSVTKGPPSVS